MMTRKEAVKILENHQKWRTGDDEVEATEPKLLSEALQIAINIIKKEIR